MLIHCASCGTKLDVPENELGSSAACPSCNGPLFVSRAPRAKRRAWIIGAIVCAIAVTGIAAATFMQRVRAIQAAAVQSQAVLDQIAAVDEAILPELAKDAGGIAEAAEEARSSIEKLGALMDEREELQQNVNAARERLDDAERELERVREKRRAEEVQLGRLSEPDAAFLRRTAEKIERGETISDGDLLWVLDVGTDSMKEWARNEQGLRAERKAKERAELDELADSMLLKDKSEPEETPAPTQPSKPDTRKERADADRLEKTASAALRRAQAILKGGNRPGYRKALRELIEEYPSTKAAKTARKALN